MFDTVPVTAPQAVDTVPTTAPAAPAATPAAEPAQPASQVPDSLKKFANEKGEIDVAKLGQSYLESERRMRQLESEKRNPPIAPPPEPAHAPDPDEQLKALVNDPEGYIASVLERATAPLTQSLAQAALFRAHPELQDSTYFAEVESWKNTLPESVRVLENTVDGADFLVKLYKREKTKPTNPALPSIEHPSNSAPAGKKTYRRSEIRNLMRTNPSEYARLSGDISLAYQEGRVID